MINGQSFPNNFVMLAKSVIFDKKVDFFVKNMVAKNVEKEYNVCEYLLNEH